MMPVRRAVERDIGAGQNFLKYRRGRWGRTKGGGANVGQKIFDLYVYARKLYQVLAVIKEWALLLGKWVNEARETASSGG